MIQTFRFKKYISNGWYFLLMPNVSGSFPSMVWKGERFDMQPMDNSDLDKSFESETSQLLDRGYQAWNSGIMLTSDAKTISTIDNQIPLVDEYRFVRKYFKSFWVYYILLLRILGLKNPFKEIAAVVKSRNVSKYKYQKVVAVDKGYDSFESKLIKSKPSVTVIIPTLNRYIYLKDAIEDLEKQTYKIDELIIIDQSDVADEEFYKQFNLKIKLIVQKERGQWLARNEAIRQSNSEWLLFFDDDSRVNADWVEQHLKGVDFYNAEISAGVSLSKIGERVPDNYSYFRWADQFDSGNALVHRKVFESVGLFDRQFDRMRMGDGEFGLRAYLHGFRSISHPFAQRVHLKVSEGGLRQVGSWDAFRTKKLLAPMPIPSVSYYYLKYFDKSSLNLLFFQGILSSTIPYKYKNRTVLMPFFLIFSVIKTPIFLVQYSKSVKRAKQMLKQGPILDFIKK
ncbi:MAG: glycosyltransferase family 2 protein [Bacteroidetes bacterium]|nr:glycosyltransferase family 2 protein [Bacteroidota bacterium]